jgi:hypothetical protein
MADLTNKKFLDQEGTGYLWSKIQAKLKEKASAADVTALDEKVDGVDTRLKTAEDTLKNLENYDDSALAASIEANADAISTLNGTDTGKSVRTIANEELATQLIPESASESLDTLQEIAAWIQSHPDDASAMNSAIAALEAIVAGIGGDGEKTTVVAYVTDAIAALNIGDYAKASELTALAGRVETLEKNTHTHSNKDVLDGISAENVKAWSAAEQNAKDYADGLASDYDKAGAADAVYTAIIALTNDEIDAITADEIEDKTDNEETTGDYTNN